LRQFHSAPFSAHGPIPLKRAAVIRVTPRNVPHRRWRIFGARPKIDWGETLQKLHCTTFGHARIPVNHDVFAHAHCVCLIAKQRQCNSRVASNILDFLVQREMAEQNSSFSTPTHTTVTCGLPSLLSVVK
jgi:hypothetical protein